MKKKFCCDASHGMYCNYYKRQSGGEMPVFVGRRYQRGHGLGSILSGLFRKVVPFITDNARSIGKNLLRTGVDIAQDVIHGQKFGEAARRHIPTAMKRTAQNIDWTSTPHHVQLIAPHLLETGADVAANVIQGTPLSRGIKRRVQQFRGQTNSGRGKRRIKRKHRDIFN